MQTCCLSELMPGETALVLNDNPALLAFGVIEGTEVTCIRKSPLGEPCAFSIRGAVIALRSEDTSLVRCKKCRTK